MKVVGEGQNVVKKVLNPLLELVDTRWRSVKDGEETRISLLRGVKGEACGNFAEEDLSNGYGKSIPDVDDEEEIVLRGEATLEYDVGKGPLKPVKYVEVDPAKHLLHVIVSVVALVTE